MGFKRLIILATMMALAACGDDSGDDSEEGSTQGDASVAAGDAAACASLTYASFGEAFEEKYCASCHAASKTGSARMGAPKDYVFDTLKQIQQHKLDMQVQVKTKAMPFPGLATMFPTEAERAQFDAWISCGPN